jgi:hypothetical protein
MRLCKRMTLLSFKRQNIIGNATIWIIGNSDSAQVTFEYFAPFVFQKIRELFSISDTEFKVTPRELLVTL